jgi:hypothetical protein
MLAPYKLGLLWKCMHVGASLLAATTRSRDASGALSRAAAASQQ